MFRHCVIAFVVGLVAAAPTTAQEVTKTEPAAAKAEPPAAGGQPATADATADFEKLFTEWKDLLAQMRELRLKYQTSKPSERPPLKEQYQKLVEQGEAMLPKVLAGAEAAFASDPNKNTDIANFLAKTVEQDVDRGHFAEAVRRATLLIDHKFPNQRIYELRGSAQFGQNHYEEAIKDFDEAEKHSALDDGKNYRKEAEIRLAEAKANDLPRIKFKTDKGDIVLELFENQAPNTVANFVSLVEKGYYNGLTFHRVLDGFMAQGGDPKGNGKGGPGYRIACECVRPDHRLHFAGSLSMAKQPQPDTGGSQFFINFVRTPHLDGLHTVFGRVIEGFDVVQKLQRRDPDDPNAPTADKIIEATVVRKRDHEYKPKTLPEAA